MKDCKALDLYEWDSEGAILKLQSPQSELLSRVQLCQDEPSEFELAGGPQWPQKIKSINSNVARDNRTVRQIDFKSGGEYIEIFTEG